MPFKKRVLRVTLSMPSGDVVLDETLDLHVRVRKAALAIQQKATIEVSGLSQSLREQLLSQFTAWNKRQVDAGQINQNWINVKIEAGFETPASTLAVSGSYATPQNTQVAAIFKGQVVLCDPASGPPDITTRLTCASRQIDKTTFVSSPAPTGTTYYEYVQWAAQQMGFGKNFICETSFNDTIVTNPGRSMMTNEALLIEIQDAYKPDVAAFIDDDILIVKDRRAIINPSDIAMLNQFIGIPAWYEYGAEFECLLDSTIRLAQAAKITSSLNPSVSGTYVITSLEYDLASRQLPFYVKATGSPPS